MANNAAGEIYIEFRTFGKQVKVNAVDAETGTEVVIVGPVTASQAELQEVAVRKLQHVMSRNGKR